jgi:HK97 family phage prohead protease
MSALIHAVPTLELRSAASGIVEGYASTFNGIDSYGDSVAPGAFANTIKRDVPVMLWQHNQSAPIGRWLDLQEDSRGLHVRGQINLQTTAGREAYSHLSEGDINGMSIGFKIAANGAEQKGDVRILREIDLKEISIVSLPADPNARVLQVKRELTKPKTLREFEKALQEIGFTRREAEAIGSKGFTQSESAEISEAVRRIRAASNLFA